MAGAPKPKKCVRCATIAREDYSPDTLRAEGHSPEDCIRALASDIRIIRGQMRELL